MSNRPIITPKSPRTKTDEELAASCGVALLKEDAIAFAQLNSDPWIVVALSGDLVSGRNRATAALYAVYGAELEILRLSILDLPLFDRLSEDSRQLLRSTSALNRECRGQIAKALYEFGGLQRDELTQRRSRIDQVRAEARTNASRRRRPTKPLSELRRVVISG
jgi:hypothetical protein